ncbi:hypothetical protein CBR_g40797 [Chara braunii]|uniref:Large ribosomal subunit protein uL4m n=1 Tax=Chara braunii TaxID=69332 RepID=A0A388LUQ2_CHABU|nr:hypothetical protein CBR_g40797 [Chara braunii]|eukprot:GBG85985.1 hypothetical protein CBR_g40797 [Chara braunii]
MRGPEQGAACKVTEFCSSCSGTAVGGVAVRETPLEPIGLQWFLGKRLYSVSAGPAALQYSADSIVEAVAAVRPLDVDAHLIARTQGILQDQLVNVIDFLQQDKGTALLRGDVFDQPIRTDIVHRVVRWQLARRQQGTHSTKGISEVSGTGKKPYAQKGSGRARHGTLRGPQFRGGAVAHGPKPRSHEISLQKKVRRLGLKVALSARLAEGKLLVLDSVEPPSTKTAELERLIADMGDIRKVLFVDGTDQVNETLQRASSNLHYVNVLPHQGLNVYSILQHDTLVLSLAAVRQIEERLTRPISR